MLYTDSMETVDWTRVEEFCRIGISESAVVDYKATWPVKLAKTIAAMANTFGGIILIGVAADEQERPITPIVGIPNEPRLELRVFDICEGAIFPPVIPEVKACLNGDGSRAVIVIRVPSSRQAHAVDGNTRVYIRTGNRNSHTESADISKIGWLLGLRGALELQRKKLIERARDHWKPLIVSMFAQHAVAVEFFSRNWLEIYAVPTYPSRQLVDTAYAMRQHATETVRLAEPERDGPFPWTLSAATGRYVQGGYGVAAFAPGPPANGYYHEVDEHGLFYYRERVGRVHDRPEVETLFGELIAERLHSFLCAVEQLYRTMQYHGPIEISVTLYGINNRNNLRYIPPGMAVRQALQHYWCPEENVHVPFQTSTLELHGALVDIVMSITTRLNLAFGYGQELERYRATIVTRDRTLRGD